MKKYLVSLLGVVLTGSLLMGVIYPPVTMAQAKLEPYVLGYLADITGPTRVIYSPELEGLQAYIKELNAKGGIQGRQVKLIVYDHKNDPGRGAAFAKKLIIDDKVLALLGLGLSPNHPPIVEEAKKEGVPIINGFTTAFPTYPPNPERLVFTTWILMTPKLSLTHINQVMCSQKLGFGKGTRIAVVGYDSPGGRAGSDLIEKWSKVEGMEVVYRGDLAPGTLDLTPWAAKIANAKPAIYHHQAGLSESIFIIPALEKLGWQGTIIQGLNALESEFAKAAALRRGVIKDIFIVSRYALRYKGVEKDIPEYAKLMDAVKKSGQEFPIGHNHVDGWIMGMIIEKALSKVGWPATRPALLSALETLEVDTRGLSGGPIRYTPTDHHGPSWWKHYRWDIKSNQPVAVTEWLQFDMKKYLQ